MTVLIIEDEPFLRELFKDQFEDRGHAVFMAENGKVGLEILAREVIDLVLTDVQMPVMSGMDFLKLARARSIDQPPVVVMTGGCLYTIEQFYEAGASAYFDKTGISVDRVISVLNRSA